MQRFKTFTSADCDDDLARLEQMVNDWLDTEKPHVHYFSSAPFGDHLVVSFVYAARYAEAGVAEEAAAVAEVFERTMGNATPDPAEVKEVLLPEVELPY
jgi:hypothetical protein